MKRFLVAISLLAVLLACNWALFNHTFFRVHDYTHAARIAELSRALADGHFPVRWSQNFGFGYGMPLFNFYAPLPYYLGSAAFLSGLNIIGSIKFLYVLTSIMVVIGGYKLGRLYFGYSGGVLVATLIGLAPYRAVNLYIRGAVSEAWALAFLPWIMWSMILIIRGKTRYWWVFAVSLAGLALSHNISLLLAAPILSLFGLSELIRIYRSNWKTIWPSLKTLVLSGVLAMCLAAFYIVPAFTEKGFTKVEEYILDGYFNYHLHFLYIRQFFQHHWQYGGSGWGPHDDISFGLGIGQLIALTSSGLALLASTWRIIRTKSLKQVALNQTWWLAISAGLCLVITLLMTLEKSLPIWEHVSVLKYAQFPWRWLTVAVPFVGLVGGVATNFLSKPIVRWFYVAAVCLAVLSINTRYFFPEKYLVDPSEYYQTSPESVSAGMSNILPDYIPKQMPKAVASATDLLANRSELGEVTVITNKTQAKLIKTVATSDRKVVWSIANFPGWQIEIDGKPVPSYANQMGLLTADVPSGEHLVGAVLTLTPTQYWSQLVSGLALIILLAGVSFKLTKKQLA